MANPEHLAKLKEGVEAWNKWRDENPSIEPDLEAADLSEAHLENAHLREAHLENAFLYQAHLENADLGWAHLEHADLEGAHLEHADLEGTHLEHAHLIEAHLEHAILAGAHLENADLSWAHLENADLSWAHLENADLMEAHLEHAHLFGAHLEQANLFDAHLEDADLGLADLENANLCEADLTDADVSRLFYLGPYVGPYHVLKDRTRFMRLWNWLRKNPIPYRKRVMRSRYQGIRGLSSCYGNRIFVRDASDQDYLDTIEEQLHTWWGRFAFWLWGLTDYGRSLMSVVVFASILISLFGAAYAHWHKMIDAGGRSKTPFTPYYFSIVTYTTLGFGDVKPNNLKGEILVSIEVILGYVTLGLLLAVLADKVARRS